MSTTINSYSIALGLNASGLIDGSKLARNEARSLQKTLNDLVNPVEKVNAKLDLLEKAVREGAIHETTAAEVKRRLTGTLNDNTAAVNANAEALRRDNALIAEGERLTRSLMTAEEKHAQEIRRLGQLRKSQAIGETTYQRGIAAANGRLAESRIVTAQVVKTPPRIAGAIQPPAPQQGMLATGAAALSNRLTSLAAGYISVYAAANFASGAIRKSADIEKASAAYEVLTGSAEQAEKMISGVRSIASQGISLTALNQSARVMLSSGVAAQTVLPVLRQIAEITGGDTERMQRMSLAFSQVAGNGRLMAEELNQLVEAGFNPLQEISRTTGISMANLRKQMADGQISFQMVQDAFTSVTSEGGRFNGMLDRVNETSAGAINSVKATFESFQISVGEALGPAIQAIAADFKESASAGGELVGIVRELTGVFVELNGSVKGVSGKGILGTMTSGLGLSQAYGSQIRATLGTSVSIWGDLVRGDMKTVIEKTQDILTPFEKIDEFLDRQMKARQAAAGGVKGTPMSDVPQFPTPPAEPSAKDVAATFNRLQDSIKKAQATAIPTVNKLWEAVEAEKRLGEIAEENQRLEREADRIREQAITPAERLAKSVADISRMQELGLLTAFEAERAKGELFKDAGKDIKIEAPKNLEVGSQEAYKFFAENANREQQKALQAEARANTEKQVAAIREVRTAVDNLTGNIKRKR